MDKKLLHVFDVDGTLTKSDSLLLLLRYLRPGLWLQLKLWLPAFPIVIIAFLQKKPSLLKEHLLKKVWRGETKKRLEARGEFFFEKVLKNDIRLTALNFISQLQLTHSSQKLVLLSASCKEWLQPLADFLQADLICTELKYDARNKFTGHFATPNCKGVEKVRRLLERYPANQYEFICYADSPSDKHLQTISRQFFYRYF